MPDISPNPPDLQALEAAVFKREFTQEQRRELAAKGWALEDGSYPIETAADLHPAALLARSGHGDAEAAKALIARRARELGAANPLDGEDASKSEGSVSIDVQLIKGEFEGKVYGVVLTPDVPDSQGDEVTAKEIEQACHAFMHDYHEPDIQHSGTAAGAVLVENYVAPVDFELQGRPVRQGSWVQAYEVHDPAVKQEVADGRLTGFSIEGTGLRTPIAA